MLQPVDLLSLADFIYGRMVNGMSISFGLSRRAWTYKDGRLQISKDLVMGVSGVSAADPARG